MKPKTPVRSNHPLKFAVIPALILITASAHAAEIAKAATGTDLSAGSSWTGTTAPGSGDVASWASGALRANLTLGADTSWAGIKVINAGGVSILTGNILSLGANGIDANIGSGSTLSLANALNLTADQTWAIGASTGLTLSGAITGTNRTITINGSSGSYVNIYSSMAGFSGTLNYGAGSRLNLRGAFAGSAVTLNMVSAKSVYADSTIGTVVIGDLATSQTGAVLGADGQNGAVTYEIGAVGNTSTWAGSIRNGGATNTVLTSIKKVGTGVWTLSNGSNIFTGSVTVVAGAIKLGTASAISTATSVTVTSNNGLQFATGVTAVSLQDLGGAGTIALSDDAAAAVQLTATNASTKTLSGILSGNGSLIKNGAGTLTLSGVNTFTGGVTLNEGRINLNSGTAIGTLGTGTVTLGVAAGPAVILDQSYRTISNPLVVNGTATILFFDNRYDNTSTLSGSGTLTVTGNSGSYLGIGDMTGFTGTLNVTSGMLYKKTASGSSASATVNLNGSASNLARYTRSAYVGTENIGALSGNAYSVLTGGNGTQTYSIGALNTDTTFAGLVKDGLGDDAVTVKLLSLTKVGTGTLTLSGTNTYTGTTTVTAGVLALTGTSIADTNTLVLNGGKVDLTGTEIVNSLYFAGALQAHGTWGSSSSTASNKDDTHFSGTGVLSVTTGTAPALGFANWITGFGLTLADQDPSADPDGDNLSNLVEYALGGDPSLHEAPSIAPVAVKSGTDYIFTYTRSHLSQADTTQTVEYGNDLAIWGSIPIGPVPGVAPAVIVENSPTAALDLVTVTLPTAGADKFFARLKVVK